MIINVFRDGKINRVHRYVRHVTASPKTFTTLLEITFQDNTKFTDCIDNEDETFTIRKEFKV